MKLIHHRYLVLIGIVNRKHRGEVLKLSLLVMIKMPDNVNDFFLLKNKGEVILVQPGLDDFAFKFLVDDGDKSFLRSRLHHSMPYLFNKALYSAESRLRNDSFSTRY